MGVELGGRQGAKAGMGRSWRAAAPLQEKSLDPFSARAHTADGAATLSPPLRTVAPGKAERPAEEETTEICLERFSCPDAPETNKT